MFDVGFSELAVIGIVAMIVIGPEELPRVARTTGHLLGRLRRYVSDVKADISREMELSEIKRLQEQVQDSALQVQSAINEHMQAIETDIHRSIAPESSEHIVAEAAPALVEPPLVVSALVEESPASFERDENQMDLFGNELPPPQIEKG